MDGTFAFASVKARDSVVTALLRYPLISNDFINDCANDSDFKKMSTESRMSAMDDGAVDIAQPSYNYAQQQIVTTELTAR
jgi:hypothetical protein